jgi:hypothetical protein
MLKQRYFFDAHCHLFTVADIPLFQLAKRLHRRIDHPLRMFLAGPKIAMMSVEKFREFIQFFESEPEQNVARVAGQLVAALDELEVEAEQVVMTPLVMDFDAGGKVDKLLPQVERLVKAAPSAEGVFVLPFVGVDPRRLLGGSRRKAGSSTSGSGGKVPSPATVRKRVKAFLDANQVRGIGSRGGWGELGKGIVGGDLIGVKLYPPLGFDVLPQKDKRLRDCHLEIYRELAHRKLPVTVHCQEKSFELASSHQEAMDFTKPNNWLKVLEFSPQLSRLRLNFGHFGGDEGVKKVVPLRNRGEMEDWDDWRAPRKPRKRGWTFEIIQMLKRFPNTYADVSAFHFGDKNACNALMWLLAFDHNGYFDEDGSANHPLLDKLMWGSDYPMILPEFHDYHPYLRAFVRTILQNKGRFSAFECPPQYVIQDAHSAGNTGGAADGNSATGDHSSAEEAKLIRHAAEGKSKNWQPLPPASEIFERLSSINPRRFLFE